MSHAGAKRPRTLVKPVEGREGFTALPDGAWVHYTRRAFASSEAQRLFLELQAGTAASPWVSKTLRVYGKLVRAPQRRA